MTEWGIKFHPDFLKDLDKLDGSILKLFYKKKNKIKENPIRLKHLSGGENCYGEEITDNVRLVYFVQGETIWFLTIKTHDDAYNEFRKRLYSLKTKYLE